MRPHRDPVACIRCAGRRRAERPDTDPRSPWTQNGVVYQVRSTGRFSQNLTNATCNDTFAINGHGYGSDGSRVFVTGVIHITVNAQGDVSVSFGNVSLLPLDAL